MELCIFDEEDYEDFLMAFDFDEEDDEDSFIALTDKLDSYSSDDLEIDSDSGSDSEMFVGMGLASAKAKAGGVMRPKSAAPKRSL